MRETKYVIFCEELRCFVKNGSWGEVSLRLSGAKSFVSRDAADDRCEVQNKAIAWDGAGMLARKKFVVRPLTLTLEAD